jgi:hypothetical protein
VFARRGLSALAYLILGHVISLAQSAPQPGVVIAARADPEKSCVGTPRISILPDGRYVAAHDFFGKNAALTDVTHVDGSRDRGATWARLAEIRGQAWFTRFMHRGALCLHGTASRYGNLTVRRSTDGGRTRTEPRDRKSGRFIRGRFHGAPVPVVEHQGRIWRAVEERVNDEPGSLHVSSLVALAAADADVLDAAN